MAEDMETIEFWPDGEISVSLLSNGQIDHVIVDLPDPAAGKIASIGFRLDHFVRIVDELRMYADHFVAAQGKA